MLTRRIIPCLDVKEGKVVKGVRFREHQILGEVLDLAKRYREQGADELVFYDITASAEDRGVSVEWVKQTAMLLDIPFCVAGGIRSVAQAGAILNAGADKVSVNSPAIERPELISELAAAFGSQAIVVGIDSQRQDNDFIVYQYTGSESRSRGVGHRTLEWAVEAQERGAGEIVLNCMSHDGVGTGYDLEQLSAVRARVSIPLVASGGAGTVAHFIDVFKATKVDAALAAGVFHRGEIAIPDLKKALDEAGVKVRPS
ncbi:MAG: imidazole glycerol phosphate synthase subunit HisF [Deltaproteobacteria bacterium]|nr:imidazole glycerol phosphate synthase subunit HisF [Deltaproteobacteria bacterium]